MLEALGDDQRPDHTDAVEWLGSDYDAELIDVEGINSRLQMLR